MSGIQILSEKILYNTIIPEGYVILGIIGCCVFLVGGILLISEGCDIGGSISFVLVLASLVLIILSVTSNKDSINYIEYKVTIDESVSLVEFCDKYEILDQEGRIYTVKERN
jgi:Na+-translocating ferredoxin:NAD+ oxidoreductase RnfA subunit